MVATIITLAVLAVYSFVATLIARKAVNENHQLRSANKEAKALVEVIEYEATEFPWEVYTLGELARMPLIQGVAVAKGLPAGAFKQLADVFRATAYSSKG